LLLHDDDEDVRDAAARAARRGALDLKADLQPNKLAAAAVETVGVAGAERLCNAFTVEMAMDVLTEQALASPPHVASAYAQSLVALWREACEQDGGNERLVVAGDARCAEAIFEVEASNMHLEPVLVAQLVVRQLSRLPEAALHGEVATVLTAELQRVLEALRSDLARPARSPLGGNDAVLFRARFSAAAALGLRSSLHAPHKLLHPFAGQVEALRREARWQEVHPLLRGAIDLAFPGSAEAPAGLGHTNGLFFLCAEP